MIRECMNQEEIFALIQAWKDDDERVGDHDQAESLRKYFVFFFFSWKRHRWS
jgi:hypothetical protein